MTSLRVWTCCLVTLALVVFVVDGLPKQKMKDSLTSASGYSPYVEQADLQAAASGHHHGRVQIKVYRGPDEHGHHDHFAPHGYWIKQPADDDHHH